MVDIPLYLFRVVGVGSQRFHWLRSLDFGRRGPLMKPVFVSKAARGRTRRLGPYPEALFFIYIYMFPVCGKFEGPESFSRLRDVYDIS